jgi:hypothetical protein
MAAKSAMVSLSKIIEPFLKADHEGKGCIGKTRFLEAVESMELDMEVEARVKLLEKAIVESNAQVGDSIRYTTFLKWVCAPVLAERAKETDKNSPRSFLKYIEVKPYGVLGTQMQEKSKSVVERAPKPSDENEFAFVDPAGLPYIKNGPSGASGASGEIYKFLQIDKDRSFPNRVEQGINAPLMAVYHNYSDKNENTGSKFQCIHVVGPNFTERTDIGRDEALFELAVAYMSVLKECIELARKDTNTFRLLPISGGIFLGKFADDISQMTAEAIQMAYSMLDISDIAQLKDTSLEMCIFMESQLKEFEEAFKKATEGAPEWFTRGRKS